MGDHARPESAGGEAPANGTEGEAAATEGGRPKRRRRRGGRGRRKGQGNGGEHAAEAAGNGEDVAAASGEEAAVASPVPAAGSPPGAAFAVLAFPAVAFFPVALVPVALVAGASLPVVVFLEERAELFEELRAAGFPAFFPVAASPAAELRRPGRSVRVSVVGVAASPGAELLGGAACVPVLPPTPLAPPPRAGPGLPDADCWSAVFFATMAAAPSHIVILCANRAGTINRLESRGNGAHRPIPSPRGRRAAGLHPLCPAPRRVCHRAAGRCTRWAPPPHSGHAAPETGRLRSPARRTLGGAKSDDGDE